jgi:hypothetical protein
MEILAILLTSLFCIMLNLYWHSYKIGEKIQNKIEALFAKMTKKFRKTQ